MCNSNSSRVRYWVSRSLSLSGIAAPPVLGVFIILATVLNPGYSNISETVSQLGIKGRPHPEVMNAGFIFYGLLINGFAYSLYLRLGKSKGAKLVWFMLAMHGLSIILTGTFQANPDTPESVSMLENTMHQFFAQLGFWSLTVGVLIFGRAVRLKSSWRGFRQFSIAVVAFNLLSGLLFMMEFSEQIEGLLQRSIYAVSLFWIEIVSMRSLRVHDQ